MSKTPLEDFTTEILAGILSDRSDIGDAFVNEVLRIEGSGFSFSTQEPFFLNVEEFPDCRVDLVVRSEDVLCFVENKVESREGYIQLDRYARVLDDHSSTKKTYLKYCTKYYDEKGIGQHEFHQYRWADVYRFLLPWKSSTIVNEYLKFLNEHDMSDNMNFSLNDLLSLQEMNQVVKKMDRYLEKIKSIFGRFFDPNKLKEANNLRQIRGNSRYILVAEYVFGGGYTELGIGFNFTPVPALTVWIWTDYKNEKADLFKKLIQNVDLISKGENWIALSKPISDFMSAENTEIEIEKWFVQALTQFQLFTTQTPELAWHI